MFVKTEERPQGEIQTLKPSEALRAGIEWIAETRSNYCGCALGTAYRQLTGRDLNEDISAEIMNNRWRNTGWSWAAKQLGIPEHIAAHISESHYRGRMTREQCADWLEAQGY